jgi:T5SS/PEP-CTERM-associated repeat protein
MRVGITYAVVGWLIIQVANATFAEFGIPLWAYRFVVIMLLCFFPVAIILAWAFELTPEGIKTSKTVNNERFDFIVTTKQLRLMKRIIFLLGAAITLSPAQAEVTLSSDWFGLDTKQWANSFATGVGLDDHESTLVLYDFSTTSDPTKGRKNLRTFDNERNPEVDIPISLPFVFPENLESSSSGSSIASSKLSMNVTPTFGSGNTLQKMGIVADLEVKAKEDAKDGGGVATRGYAEYNVYFTFEVTSEPVVLLITGFFKSDIPAEAVENKVRHDKTASSLEIGGNGVNFSQELSGGDTERPDSFTFSHSLLLQPGVYSVYIAQYAISHTDGGTNGLGADITASASTNIQLQFIHGGFVPWINPLGGSFDAGSNWAGGIPPSATSVYKRSAIFSLLNTYTVSLNGTTHNDNAYIAGGDVKFDLNEGRYSMGGDEGLKIGGGSERASLTIINGRISVDPNGDGRVTIGGGSEYASLRLLGDRDTHDDDQLRANQVEIKNNGGLLLNGSMVVGNLGLTDVDSTIIQKSVLVRSGAIMDVGQLVIAGGDSHGIVDVFGRLDVSGLPDFTATTREDDTPILIVGAGGPGAKGILRLTNGGSFGTSGVIPYFIDIGFNEGSEGVIEVSGVSTGNSPKASSLEIGIGEFTIGGSGKGLLDIHSSGWVDLGMGEVELGSGSDARGTLRVTGTNSSFSSPLAVIGGAGNGNLHVRQGGSFSAGFTHLARDNGSFGLSLIEGESSTLKALELIIGVEGTATLEVKNGAVVDMADLSGQEDGGTVSVSLTYGQSKGNLLLTDATLEGFFRLDVGASGLITVTDSTVSGYSLFVYQGGSVELDNGIFAVDTVEVNGRVCGTGTFTSREEFGTNIVNVGQGRICPGSSPGQLTIIGDYEQSAAGTLEIEIAGPAPGTEHDVLKVTGNVTLDGTLELVFIDDYLPSEGDVFEFLPVEGQITGEFSTIEVRGVKSTWQFDVGSNPEGGLTIESNSNAEPGGGFVIGGNNQAFQAFQNLFFTEEEIIGGDADPFSDYDGDGLTTLLERFLGSDPTDPNNTISPFQFKQLPSGNLEISYNESTLYNQVVDLHTNTNLSPAWYPIPDTDYVRTSSSHPENPNAIQVSLEITNPVWNAQEKRFFQLEFSEITENP